MQLLKKPFLALCLVSAFALSALDGLAAVMPEFGPSVEFDVNDPQTTVAKLKGKAVIVIFFQADKAGSAWSGKLIAELQESFGADKAVVLMAIKTDGGGVNAAKTYLTSKGADLDQWVVASDKGAKYSSDLVGDPLWYYVLVSPEGNIIERGKAGITHNVVIGPNKKTESHFNLANPNILKRCPKRKTVLPADKTYQPPVKKLARLAELGDTAKALALCTALLPKPKEREAATELIADLQPVVEKNVATNTATLNDTAAPSPARYDAFNELSGIMRDLKSHPLAAKIGPVLAKARQDPALQKEARAESIYKALAARLQKATPRDRPRLGKEFEAFAKQFEGTKYGEVAAGVASDIASEVSADTK